MLYQEYAEYEPTFKIWWGTNHKPVIRETTLAMWRRVRLIPFSVTITDSERDREMAAKLLMEAPGILAWAVRGCLEWQKHGLGMAEAVARATAEYRADSDEIGRFIEARCVVGPDRWVQATELYRAYQAWADSEGIKAMSQTAFGVRLSERGHDVQKRDRKTRGRAGLALREAGDGLETGRDGLEPVLGKSPMDKTLEDFPEIALNPSPKAPNPSPEASIDWLAPFRGKGAGLREFAETAASPPRPIAEPGREAS
jgi:putative DNA primase/helicase